MISYSKHDNRELLEILNKYSLLTFSAKIELKQELLKRKTALDSKDFKGLNDSINQGMDEVKTLKFLNDIGFNVSWFDNKSFEITRSGKATVVDLVAIFLGIIFSIIGIIGLSVLISYLSPKVNFGVFNLIFNILLLGLGFFGFKIFYNGFDRLIKYKDFKLIVDRDEIILRKRFDLKIKELKKEASTLKLDNSKEQVVSLMSGDIEILSAISPSFKAKLALKEIIDFVE